MNTNYILLTQADKIKVKGALQLFVNSYQLKEVRLLSSLKDAHTFLIQLPENMDLAIFLFCVNYMHYPEVKNFAAVVKGYWTILPQQNYPAELNYKRMLFYVSENDTEGDNVFGITEGSEKTLKFDFSKIPNYKKLKSKEFDFHENSFDYSDFQPLQTFSFTPQKSNSPKGCLPLISFLLISMLVTLYTTLT